MEDGVKEVVEGDELEHSLTVEGVRDVLLIWMF